MIFNEIVEYQLKQVFGLEYLRECLELRLKLLRENEASKSEFEKNENDILYYQTRNSINKVFHQINEKRKELQETMIIYFQELQDLKTKKNKDGNDNLPDNS